MRKLRLTPLNIVAALGIALLIVVSMQPKAKTAGHNELGALYLFILGSLVVVSFVSDLIFRFILKDLKRIWLVETVFIAIAITLFLILQK